MKVPAFSLQERIGDLVAALEAEDDGRNAPARELVSRVLELHAQGITAMMDIATTSNCSGDVLIERFLAEPRIVPLLLLHGVHPHSLEKRVRTSIERLRAELGAQGIQVDVLEVEGYRVRLKAEFNGSGLSRSVAPLRSLIERGVLGLAPEIESIEIEGLPEHGDIAVVPLSSIRRLAC